MALVDHIRKQPFSVILLDECEKAHPQVWDLFLQVFDDGRLTDRLGRTADFRHAIIILTSNLGAALPMGASLGFAQESRHFNPKVVERAIEKSFRKEFLNRLDRIIVFRPLSRETMREILRKELEEAFQRRGLRNRSWAVEWEPGALDFLLEKGFTIDLGARPLKRAVERYLLTPLANTIVNHQYPEGDQFLLVKAADEQLEVAFIDPDAVPEEPVAPAFAGETEPSFERLPRLESLVLDPRGSPRELASLQRHYEELRRRLETAAWRERKQDALRQMAADTFGPPPIDSG
jgi:ATP-dependent Clp protease ATP-binding subunit ClpC